ncbi:YEATS family protein [Colletotrichum scovillei]|uniref:YEATS family protein n=1 Tax=Colletotrichum scovillei TaxID=1209932 RepID=A0A9P7R6P2_9PEZI|nr:YEATS family protein [Colletotrichum scovillei]KAG7078461.1 YEATS family protein [Colletotrichum scovillei]
MDTAMTDGEQQWPAEPPGAPRWHRDENDFRNRPTQASAAGVAGSTNPPMEVNHGSGNGAPDTGLGQTYCLFHSNYSASARSQCRLVPNSSLEEMYNCGSQVQEPAPPTRVDAIADTMSMHSQTSRDEPDVQMSDDTSSQSTILSPPPAPPGVQAGKRKASPEAELPEKKRPKDEGPNGGPDGGQGYL